MRLAACSGLPWRVVPAGDSACIFVYPLFRGLGKTRDNPRHDILAIDVGNTRLKWALYDAHRPGAALIAHGAEFLDHIDRLAESSWGQLPVPTRILGCVVAGDAAKRRVSRWSKWCVGRGAAMGGVVGRRAGAYQRLRPPFAPGVRPLGGHGGRAPPPAGPGPARPLVVVMVGTAVTVECIDVDGVPGRPHPAGPRHHAACTGDRHRWPACAHGRGAAFPTNTSDALTSGGTYAIAGAVERMYQHLLQHCGQEPACIMTGGAGWKMAPSMTRPFELVDNLIFDGLLEIAAPRFAVARRRPDQRQRQPLVAAGAWFAFASTVAAS